MILGLAFRAVMVGVLFGKGAVGCSKKELIRTAFLVFVIHV